MNPPAPASPCISLCRIDSRFGWCAGCLRKLDEIGRWRDLADDDRRKVLALLPARRRQAAACC